MGLSMVLVGHVNFLLGALVHGVVLRHLSLHKQARAMEYAVSNVFAITSGLVVSGHAWASRRCRGDGVTFKGLVRPRVPAAQLCC